MTYPPGEQPHTPPQDPWSGTQGTASAPTDPLPQPVRGQFTPGVAAPSPAAWSQETVAHSDPYRAPAGGGGRPGLYVLVVLLVVVLGGAGGFGAWWAITKYASGIADPTPTETATTDQPSTPGATETPFQPRLVEVGTCMINRGTGTRPNMMVLPCDSPGALEVLKIRNGEDIPEDPETGGFTDDATGIPSCSDVPSTLWYGWDSPNDAQDYVYCLAPAISG